MFSQEKYLKALNFAAKAHKEQKTPYGLPYLTHLTSVAMEVIHACEESKLEIEKSDLAISVALLHDTIEDTNITYDDLYNEFDAKIAEGVEALTKDFSLSKKDQMADSINRLMSQPYEVQMVKLADRITNLQKPPESWDNLKILNYHKEAKFILSCLKNCNVYLSKRLEDKINNYIVYIN
ncbi:HD domain-containing protein [Halarcobacter anaerophilus]|uniref:Phosphohydrolase n=1 Tax=Halarcobacter anaerophilus TaxID=877500 RepID=A0A4Q0Y3E9_9BACT|nr:HD domain-containing protein [Halarcobacter anaerophilus]QDF29412.1 bifunctional (p)ppGpp synthetase/guanosine-3',5'-bis(diphosphate) 3'-pyrophosphohydrolase [Halarcobacter anaerophilus]RXJ64657.1 phosphohydrolase [Halarcobacter anaerophilus]